MTTLTCNMMPRRPRRLPHTLKRALALNRLPLQYMSLKEVWMAQFSLMFRSRGRTEMEMNFQGQRTPPGSPSSAAYLVPGSLPSRKLAMIPFTCNIMPHKARKQRHIWRRLTEYFGKTSAMGGTKPPFLNSLLFHFSCWISRSGFSSDKTSSHCFRFMLMYSSISILHSAQSRSTTSIP